MKNLIEHLKCDEISLGKDIVSIHRPNSLGKFGGYPYVYRNLETRAIDKEFGLDGSYVLKGEFMSEVLLNAVSYNSLRNHKVASTLKYFIELAINTWGVIVGIDENQLAVQEKNDDSLQGKIFVNNSIEFGNLVRKNVNGDNVLFPSKICLIKN